MREKIVVYSWTGNTAAAAVALQEEMGIEAFLLVEEKERQGNKGFALGGTQASFGMKTAVKALPDIADTDVLILGMPVWAGTTPPAINTFFANCDCKGKTVYAFATQQSDGIPKKLESKLRKRVEKLGGGFKHLFVLQVPQGKQLGVDEARERAAKWAQRIRAGE